VQFRQKSFHEQYSKYQWIELDLVKNERDFRPESYRPYSHEGEIKILGEIKADGDDWYERRKTVLNKVHDNLSILISEAKDKSVYISLAVFKPKEIIDFKIEKEAEREWSPAKIASLQQLNLFEKITGNKKEVVRKLPYKFSYHFSDQTGRNATLMIEDWEVEMPYWNCLSRHEGNEAKACEDVKKKYFDDFAKTKDLYLFLGTTYEFHMRAPNPFVIIGTFHPKKISQLGLF